MGAARNLLFKFLGDSKSLERASQRSAKSLGKVDKQVHGSTQKLGLMQTVAGKLGGALAVGALFKGIGAAIGRAEEMDSKYAITKQIIADTGGAAGLTADQIADMSKEMSMTTGLDKAVVTDAANVLLTFKEIKDVTGENNDLFSQALVLTGDMATVFGGSATDAAKQLGKALNDPIGGIGALSRVGVQFTEDQKAVIRSFVETGDVAAAQKVILGELQTQVGGTAVASADATAIMGVAFEEVTEIIGAELLPAIQDIAPAVVKMTEAAGPSIALLAGKLGDYAADTTKFADGLAVATDASEGFGDRVGGAASSLGNMLVSAAKWNLITAPVVAGLGQVKDHFSNVEGSIDDVVTIAGAGGAYGRAMIAASEATIDAADAADDAAAATANLGDELLALVSPVFAAKKAEDAYKKVLQDVTADSVLTSDETDELTLAHLRMKAAADKVTPEAMTAYKDEVKRTRDAVVPNIDAIASSMSNIGSKSNLARAEAHLDRLERLTGRRIEVDLSSLRVATRADLQQAVTRELFALQRRGFRLIPV